MESTNNQRGLEGATREEFLARVRGALNRDDAPPPAPQIDESIARLARAGDNLFELFIERATSTGMKVQRTAAGALMKVVIALLHQVGAKRVVTGVSLVPELVGLDDALRADGMQVVDWRATPGLESQFDTDAGVTDVHAALAETGTLVCGQSSPAHSRGLSLVPPVHIAVVKKSDIVPDMLDYWARVRVTTHAGVPTTLPSSIAFITGPSKTSDIEGILIVGVHGPRVVYIVAVEDA